MEGIKLLVFIIPRGRGNELIRLCADEGVSFRVMLHGRGTAAKEVLDILGIGETEKDVALLSVAESRSQAALRRLAHGMRLDKPGGGIAFSIPFSAAASQLSSYAALAGNLSAPRKTGEKAKIKVRRRKRPKAGREQE